MWYDEKFLDEDREDDIDSLSEEEYILYGRLDNNGIIPLPSLIYDKSYTMYIQLSNNNKEKAMDELFNLIVWFVNNKFTVKRRKITKEEYNKLTSFEYQVNRKYSDLPITYLESTEE